MTMIGFKVLLCFIVLNSRIITEESARVKQNGTRPSFDFREGER